MMLEQVHAKSSKGISNIVVSVFLIVVAVTLVSILFLYTKQMINKSPIDTSCFDVLNSFSVKKACYSNNEIEVELKRNFDDLQIDKLVFSFYPSNSKFEITGEKRCSDVRLEGKEYGHYYELISQGNSLLYIFNSTKEEKVKFAVELGGKLCSVEEKKIENC